MKGCNLQFLRKDSLIQHLESAHSDGVTLKPKVTLKFSTVAEFNEWKEKEEEKTFSYFTTRFGQGSRKTKLFYCQHDGQQILYQRKGKTSPNTKGKVKVGHNCIAKIKIVLDDNSISLDYYPTQSLFESSRFCLPALAKGHGPLHY